MNIQTALKLSRGARLIWFPGGFQEFDNVESVHLIDLLTRPVPGANLSKEQNVKHIASVSRNVTRPPWVDPAALKVSIVFLYPWTHDLWRRIKQNASERKRLIDDLVNQQSEFGSPQPERPKKPARAVRIAPATPRYDLFLDTARKEGERAKETP